MGLKRALKYTLAGLVVLLGLLVSAVAFWFFTFDSAAYKARLSTWVQSHGGHILEIRGEFEPMLFPAPGLRIGKTRLLEPDGITEVAAAQSFSATMALWPLLRGEVGIGTVILDGLELNLVRSASGRLNIEGLFDNHAVQPLPSPSATPDPLSTGSARRSRDLPSIDLAGLSVRNATIRYSVMGTTRQTVWDQFNLQIGHLADGVTTPIALQGHLHMVESAPQSAEDHPTGRTDLSVFLQARLTPDATRRMLKLEQLQWHLEGEALGQEQLRADIGLETMTLNPAALALQGLALDAHLLLPHAKQAAAALKLRGEARVDFVQQTAQGMLAGLFDDTTVNLHGQLHGFEAPVWRLDMNLGTLDLDRYLPQAGTVPGTAGTAQAAESAASAPLTSRAHSDQPAGRPADLPVNLTALFGHDVQASLRVAELRAWQLRLTSLRMEARLLGEHADLKPVTAVLYDGGVNGSVSVSAASTPARPEDQTLHAHLDLRGVHVAPLLQDLFAQQPIVGRGNVALDLRATGGSTRAITRTLEGTVGVQLSDGAIRGFDVNASLRALQNRISGTPMPADEARPKTDFSEFQASLRIRQGVARNDDLSAKTPLLRLAGHGVIDLVQETLDYDLQALLATTLEGQGGADLGQLKGLAIPLHLSGPFGAIAIQMGTTPLSRNTAKDLIDQKRVAVQQDLQKRLDDEKAKATQNLQRQAEDAVKGWLGR